MGIPISYKLIRSDRKTIAVQITPDGNVIVRCPRRMTLEDVNRFLESKADWIVRHLAAINLTEAEKLTQQEIRQLREKARQLVTNRVQYYAPIIGVTYNQISIRSQKTRWGSCSSKGNLSFNCLLALVPPEVLDYVVVHELCHRKELNHSRAFWTLVENVMPDYKLHRKWLSDNGNQLIAKL